MSPSSSSGVKSCPRRRAPSNKAMERTHGEAACSWRACVAAGRSSLGRWAAMSERALGEVIDGKIAEGPGELR